MQTFRCLCTFHLRGTSEDDNIMRRLLNPQTKAERSATVENSLSCEHVHQDFCCRRATGAFLAVLTSLVGLCKLILSPRPFKVTHLFREGKELCIYRSYLLENLPERPDASGFDWAGRNSGREPCFTNWMEKELQNGLPWYHGNFLSFVL